MLLVRPSILLVSSRLTVEEDAELSSSEPSLSVSCLLLELFITCCMFYSDLCIFDLWEYYLYTDASLLSV